ncbi:MAG: AAA family ATPase [Campylobacterota bacterium]
MSEILDGYAFYKSIHGTKYDKTDNITKTKLQQFRKNLGSFTDRIFANFIQLGKGHWQSSGNFTKYMWNRYKPKQDDSSLVIYFNASTNNNEGLFISIGLIDDRLTVLEKEKNQEIYDFLEEGCKKITSKGFERKDTGWGERVFSIIDEDNFETLDYNDLIQKLKQLYEETYKKFYTNQLKNKSEKKDIDMVQPLNQILYGPPGTGKTYNTINRAIEIIENRKVLDDENREALKAKFEEYKKAGQIEFVTFHQSYGYEEFVEGIKAKSTDNGIEYKIESGILKKLTKIAKENFENSRKTNLQLIQEKSLKQKLEIFLNDALENETEFVKTKGGKFKIIELGQDEITIFAEDSNYSDKRLSIPIDEFYKILETDLELKTSRQMAKDIFGLNNQRQRDTYYFAMSRKFHETKIADIQAIENEEPLKNYILIIDEINRGNISKIFGELITLIETSKRIGAEEEIRVKLPYSGDEFGVPQNLYIIGTMNTADRSIALMDTALRRRFDFEEMMPKAELLDFDIEILKQVQNDEKNSMKLNIKSMLEIINKRVEYLYDRDHTIGHAYFMSLKDKSGNEAKIELDNIFRNKIIPLLQEYFYDDWEKILMVLGKDGFIEKIDIEPTIFSYRNDDYIEEKQSIYKIKQEFDYSEFVK